jgi:hypothetical protein
MIGSYFSFSILIVATAFERQVRELITGLLTRIFALLVELLFEIRHHFFKSLLIFDRVVSVLDVHVLFRTIIDVVGFNSLLFFGLFFCERCVLLLQSSNHGSEAVLQRFKLVVFGHNLLERQIQTKNVTVSLKQANHLLDRVGFVFIVGSDFAVDVERVGIDWSCIFAFLLLRLLLSLGFAHLNY